MGKTRRILPVTNKEEEHDYYNGKNKTVKTGGGKNILRSMRSVTEQNFLEQCDSSHTLHKIELWKFLRGILLQER